MMLNHLPHLNRLIDYSAWYIRHTYVGLRLLSSSWIYAILFKERINDPLVSGGQGIFILLTN
ncbi:hypothetical protein PMIT1313_00211 [Prochlorococcus marinus str. MIT 1313]|nr:hypothetical protein PMIT1313_00211 [Prochlorococcus marinus str. MIT 1313]KZR76907.1 hypothetical protein PMIT1318_00114 [Prochlorococcus marinus str. MIT 1318]